MPASEWAWVALGSNLGDRATYLSRGRCGLAGLPGSVLVALTAVEETAPIGPPGQGPYLNQMGLLATTLDPGALLDALGSIEARAGRRRRLRWGPRTLDLDLVRYGTRVMTTDRLTLPHPAIPDRVFWQRELEDLAPYAR